MKSYLLVFIGGGFGSITRFLTAKLLGVLTPSFPFATLTANFLSCLILGFTVAFGLTKTTFSPEVKLLIITGFCGGFSTFSSFTYETVELFKSGQILLALCNVLLNIALSIIGLYLGFLLSKQIG